MSKRINIILPDSTVAVLDRVVPKGNRSRFIDGALDSLHTFSVSINLAFRLLRLLCLLEQRLNRPIGLATLGSAFSAPAIVVVPLAGRDGY